MRLSGFLAVMMATTAVVGSTSALAQSASGTVSLSEAQAAQRNTPAPQRRGLRLNDRGRWGLDFNLNQPVGRETDWGDVEAGAYYRLNDRLRVGAAAAVA
ncbi:NtrZ family periplasmic regulatory protein, partial [Brevundimonas sp. UBA5718]